MWISVIFLIGTVVAAAHGAILWECDNFPDDAPADGCDWNRSHFHWGEENVDVVPDPGGRPGRIMRVLYPEGSWVTNDNNKGGAQFTAKPFPPGDERTLEYEVWFSANFEFVRGGKLPGLFGGEGTCAGGGHDQTCFSTRYMWRTDGDGEVYGYIPNETDDWFCDHDDVYCNFDYGHSFGRGSWRINPGRWHTLSQTIKLNSVGSSNGEITVNFDGSQVYRITGLRFRTSSSLQIDTIYFSTFFGGSDSSWASARDVLTYYRNFKVMD